MFKSPQCVVESIILTFQRRERFEPTMYNLICHEIIIDL